MRPALAALGAGSALVLSGCSFSFFSGAAVPADSVEDDVVAFFLDSGREVTVECPEDLEAEVGATLECTMIEDERERVVEVVVDSVDEGQVSYSFRVLLAEGAAEEGSGSADSGEGSDGAAQTGDAASGTAGSGSGLGNGAGDGSGDGDGDGQGEGTAQTAGPGDDAAQTSGAEDQVWLPAVDVEETVAAEILAQTGEAATVTCPEDLVGIAGTRLVCDITGPHGPASVEVVVDEVTETEIHYSFEVVG